MKLSKITAACLSMALLTSALFLTNCKKDKKTEDPEPAPCVAPVISSSAQTTVNASVYSFTCTVSNINNSSLITVTQNGSSVPFSYNTTTGLLNANLTLTSGNNTITVNANGCSLVSSNFNVLYASNTLNLTGKNFKLTGYTINPGIPVGGTIVTDLYAQMPPCTKDDLFNFTPDNKYTLDEGGSKCNSTDPQTVSGTWLWNTNETILTMTDNGSTDPLSLTILTNDGTTLKGKYTEVDNGITYEYTITFTKQ